jgi:hypothetical protein
LKRHPSGSFSYFFDARLAYAFIIGGVRSILSGKKIIVLCSLLIGLALALALSLRAMTCIPTDAGSLYLPAAARLLPGHFLSEMHQGPDLPARLFLYGKEISILHFSQMQRVLHDTTGLWPLTLVCIIAFILSSIVLFWVARGYWGNTIGMIVYGIFMTSFWPYMYVLMVKHQPTGFLYFLLSIYSVQRAGVNVKGYGWFLAAAFFLGLSFFSTTIAPMFVLFYAAAVVERFWRMRSDRQQLSAGHWSGIGAATVIGFMIPAAYVSWPDPWHNIQGYLEYVRISRQENWFYYFQNILREWVNSPAETRGGWPWVFRYCFLAMPVLFPVLLGCSGYLVFRWFFGAWSLRGFLISLGMVLLAFSPAILAEWRGIAQYGANYFALMAGALMLSGYVLSVSCRNLKPSLLWRWRMGVAVIMILHAAVNGYVFVSDVFPSRMVEARLSRELQVRGIAGLHVYYNNYMTDKIISQLEPALRNSLTFDHIQNVFQAKTGYILVPPLVVSSVYFGMITPNADFDQDIYLNEIVRQGRLGDYAVIDLPTMATSRIWRQETEICSYRDLVLHHFGDEYAGKSRVMVLDAQKLFRDRLKFQPRDEYRHLVENGVRNIGAETSTYRYKGELFRLDTAVRLSEFSARMYKVGNPQDRLTAYIYRGFDGVTRGWRPAGEQHASLPVGGASLMADTTGARVVFTFARPLLLPAGNYHIVIYRDGPSSARDFYRVFVDDNERQIYTRAAGNDALRAGDVKP